MHNILPIIVRLISLLKISEFKYAASMQYLSLLLCTYIHYIVYIQHCIVYIERNACILGVEIELWGDPKNYIPALKISKYRYSILEFNIVELAFISALFIKTILT